MKCHRVKEVIELLQQHWLSTPDLSLIDLLTHLAKEAGCQDNLANLSDEILIYQLKMRNKEKNIPIPGLLKDYEEDFKSALLKARGIK